MDFSPNRLRPNGLGLAPAARSAAGMAWATGEVSQMRRLCGIFGLDFVENPLTPHGSARELSHFSSAVLRLGLSLQLLALSVALPRPHNPGIRL
jgi:hypothetical protein